MNYYKQYNIDKNRLSRDYDLNPISKSVLKSFRYCWEDIPENDLRYLFLELNLEKNVIASFFNISEVKLSRDLHKYKILKNKPKDKNVLSEIFYQNYNIDKNKLSRDYIINPLKIIKKKGGKLEIPFKSDIEYFTMELKLPIRIICEYFNINETLYHKWLKRYGIETPLKDICIDENRIEKAKCISEKYNIDVSKLKRDYITNPLKIVPSKCPIGYIVEKPYKEDFEYLFIELNITRKDLSLYFGVSDPQIKIWNRNFKCIKSRNKIIENCFKNWSNNDEIWSSSNEDKIFEYLQQKYIGVCRQYKSEKYPFFCDFYIPSKDLYIEYQGYWSHGNEAYIGTKEQNERVKLWKAKNGPQYMKAIINWTKKDVLKRETAKKNKLNWIEFFNMDEFMEWYNKQ